MSTYRFRLYEGVPLGRLDADEWADEYAGEPRDKNVAIGDDLHRYGVLPVDVEISNGVGALALNLARDDNGVPHMEWVWYVQGEIVSYGSSGNWVDALRDAIVSEP